MWGAAELHYDLSYWVGSDSGFVGIFDVNVAFIKDVVIPGTVLHILIEARQRFIQTAVIKVTKDEHGGIRFVLKTVMNTVRDMAGCSGGISSW